MIQAAETKCCIIHDFADSLRLRAMAADMEAAEMREIFRAFEAQWLKAPQSFSRAQADELTHDTACAIRRSKQFAANPFVWASFTFNCKATGVDRGLLIGEG